MTEENKQELSITPEKQIATNIEDLPELPDDYVRVVHITHPSKKQDLLDKGLDYEKYGMAMSTARAWSKPEDVEVWSDDPRFSVPGLKALILDIPNSEWKLHNRTGKCPGIISPEQIVGFVDAIKPDK